MDTTKVAEILQNIFKQALEYDKYEFGLPVTKGTSNKIATQTLLNSVEVQPFQEGFYILMEPYGKFVNSGRLPGKYVPLTPLETWIKVRNINFTDKNGKALSSRAMAAIISKHIYKFGIPAKPFGWIDYAIELMFENKELANAIEDMTVEELLNKIEQL